MLICLCLWNYGGVFGAWCDYTSRNYKALSNAAYNPLGIPAYFLLWSIVLD
jgi:hypothetical protein